MAFDDRRRTKGVYPPPLTGIIGNLGFRLLTIFRQPFLAQAEQDKLDYEAARKLYENGSIAYESSIDFGTSPFVSCLGTSSSLSPEQTGLHLGHVSFSHVKPESSGGEGEGFSS